MKITEFQELKTLSEYDLKELENTTIETGRMKSMIAEMKLDILFGESWVLRSYSDTELIAWVSLEETDFYPARTQLATYVKIPYRRRGIASDLIKQAGEFFERKVPKFKYPLMANPWDVRGKLFFKSNKIKLAGDQR